MAETLELWSCISRNQLELSNFRGVAAPLTPPNHEIERLWIFVEPAHEEIGGVAARLTPPIHEKNQNFLGHHQEARLLSGRGEAADAPVPAISSSPCSVQ